MMRQCLEAHHIETLGKTCAILNRRGEWGQNLPPKLVLEGENIPESGKSRKRVRRKEGNEAKRQKIEKDDTNSNQKPSAPAEPGNECPDGNVGTEENTTQETLGRNELQRSSEETEPGRKKRNKFTCYTERETLG